MKLVKNQKRSMILIKIFIFIGESKTHAGLCPFHHRKWHVFDGFGVKYMNFFDVLCPWGVSQQSVSIRCENEVYSTNRERERKRALLTRRIFPLEIFDQELSLSLIEWLFFERIGQGRIGVLQVGDGGDAILSSGG